MSKIGQLKPEILFNFIVMKNIFIIPILSLFIFSCQDSSEQMMDPEIVIEAPESKMEIEDILSGTSSKAWKNQSFQLEIFGSLECRTDDLFTFFSDGTYEYDGGALLCGDSDSQQIVRGIWEVDLENNQLIFDKGTDKQAIASYITIKDDLIRLMGSWNNLNIDAQYTQR